MLPAPAPGRFLAVFSPPQREGHPGNVWYESKLQGKITVCTEYGGGGMCHAADYDNLLAGAQTQPTTVALW